MRNIPRKVVIEITDFEYSTTILDETGRVIDRAVMRMRNDRSFAGTDLTKLQEKFPAFYEYNFGGSFDPTGISMELDDMANGCHPDLDK